MNRELRRLRHEAPSRYESELRAAEEGRDVSLWFVLAVGGLGALLVGLVLWSMR